MDILQGCWVLRRSVSNGMMQVANLLRPSLRSYPMSLPLHWVSQKRLHGQPSLKRRENRLLLSVAVQSQKFAPSLKCHTQLAKVWLLLVDWVPYEGLSTIIQDTNEECTVMWMLEMWQIPAPAKDDFSCEEIKSLSNLIMLCKNVFA